MNEHGSVWMSRRHSAEAVVAPLARPPLLEPPGTLASVTRGVCQFLERPAPRWWGPATLVTGLMATLVLGANAYLVGTGIGVWGVQMPVVWGFAIINFVFWIGIGHAGTLISAILLLTRQRWRNSLNRAAEASAIFAVACGAVFPLIHIGRQWMAWYLFPIQENIAIWPNFRAPLLWDVFAVLTYLTVSVLYWYLGMIPDFATLREREKHPWRRKLFAVLSMGWSGSAREWNHYEMGYLCLAGLLAPLVLSVHSFVSCDFAATILPGWHATIFPPYFGAGAIFGGFAVILVLLIPLRELLPELKKFILPVHIEQMAKWLLATGSLVGYVYLTELFIAWYGANPFERYAFWNRITGPYAPEFWGMLACNALAPQILWFRAVRRRPWAVFGVAILANVGMWLERFVIIVISLHRDFLPSSWSLYHPTWVDIGLLVGSVGLFLFLFLLFLRFLPVIAMFEVKALCPPAEEDAPAAPRDAAGSTLDLSRATFGLGARFPSAAALCRAGRRLRALGFRRIELYSPYPFHGLAEAAGHRKSWVSACVLGGGLFGFCLGASLELLTSMPRPAFLRSVLASHLLDLFYPLVVQGKPYISLPAFFAVVFETTALFSAFGAVVGILLASSLPRFYRPIFHWELFSRRSQDDGFFLVVERRDPRFSADLPGILAGIGALEISPIPE
ncbi:Polysulphide reductase [Methylacidimicrobium sp. AP8]|uniref:quinol:electron acceptor oxidoreductase subunit ActD n=1 Tax=Methylacidimicrobium sp. AP8 TaxID=2730359 RepID=UPI0018BFC74E|nr:quinol:electron acceptor oxidoreductase subunit ActD [Methylacidimicrobium sp. AP8]CAB4244251.1 Polysulphide reductase [Methylacidimicrobium sp. AP8]